MIILTGASGGIGNKIVAYLAENDNVLGIYNKTLPAMSKASLNKKLVYEQLDIEQSEEIKLFIKKWKSKLSKLTLIHFAVSSIDQLAANYPECDWDQVMNVNLKGNFLLTQALLPHMIQEKWGRIIHISSVVGTKGLPGTIAYSTSKTGLFGMSAVLAKEYARFNITSNILVLGYFSEGLINTLNNEKRERIINQIPAKRLGKISNIANAIDFLIKSEYVNNSVINKDGGI